MPGLKKLQIFRRTDYFSFFFFMSQMPVMHTKMSVGRQFSRKMTPSRPNFQQREVWWLGPRVVPASPGDIQSGGLRLVRFCVTGITITTLDDKLYARTYSEQCRCLYQNFWWWLSSWLLHGEIIDVRHLCAASDATYKGSRNSNCSLRTLAASKIWAHCVWRASTNNNITAW